jgi:FKBP-type peptidyl-prolyl cis-trans isomerase SlyD
MKTAHNMVVSFHYTLKDDAGEILDCSSGREPLSYLHGHGNIVPGLEKALEGTSVGHRAHVAVAANEGYGDADPDLVFEAPREHFPGDIKLEAGARVYADGPQGRVTFRVVRLTEKGAVLDGNHPLAGKQLHFDVEVVDVRTATSEEMAHGHVHGEGHHHDH